MDAETEKKDEVEEPSEGEKEYMTCHRCSEKDVCEYAWDPYNTDGDCLASK